MNLNDTFNKEVIKKMTFEEFKKTQFNACKALQIDLETTYTALTGKKIEKKVKK